MSLYTENNAIASGGDGLRGVFRKKWNPRNNVSLRWPSVAAWNGFQSAPRQFLQVDKVRVSGEGGERLIGRIAVTEEAEREYPLIGLSGVGEKVYPAADVTRETADTVRPRQTEYGQ